MSIVHALLLGLLGGIGIWDSRIGGMWMLDRPLVLGPIVGLILGDFKTGIIVGGSLELIMMGIVGIGSATPPDTVSGAILATAFAIVSKLDVSAAVALALPIATLGQLVGIFVRTANGYFVHMADKAAENADFSGIDKALWGGAILFFVSYFLLVFLGAFLGSSVIGAFVKMIPQFVTDGLNAASGMLPALGIAILMQLLFDKKNAAFFFIGWAMTALFSVNTVGAAVVGTAIAYTIYQYTISNKNHNNSVDMISDDEGPFSPERAGGLPAFQVIDMATREGMGKKAMMKKVKTQGGLMGYFGVNDTRIVEKMMMDGDEKAKLIYDAMILNVARNIAKLSVYVDGKVDNIILTGGIAYSEYFTKEVAKRVEFIAPVIVYAGENEMESLALGALRVQRGEEEARTSTKVVPE